MILGIFWFLVANGAVLLGARAIQRRLETGTPSMDLLLFMLIRLLLISAAVLLAGLVQLLRPWALGACGLVALAFLIWFRAHRNLPRLNLPDCGRLAGIFALVVALRLLVQVWFFAPHLGDAVAYHLPKIAEWVRAGGFTEEMGLHAHVTFPAGFELIETWWVVFFHHDLLIEIAGVEFILLAFVATYALAIHLEMSPRWAFFAALLYTLTPGLHLTTTSCMNDGPAAALVVTTAALIVWRVPVPILLMTVGLGLGVKPTYGFTLPGLILLWWWIQRADRSPGLRPGRILGSSLAVLGLAVGAYWYLRNTILFGNPFHPLGSPDVFNPTSVQLGPSFASFWGNVSDLVEIRIYDNQAPYGANVDHSAGWGAAAFSCGLIALLILVRTDVRFRRIAIGFFVSLAAILVFVQNDPWCLKYVFFFPAILCLATARLAQTSQGVAQISWIALGFSFLGTMLPYDLQLKHLKVLARQSWHERSGLLLKEQPIGDDQIACFGGYKANAYQLYGPDYAREVVYLRSETAEELLRKLHASGIRLLYAAPVGARQEELLQKALRIGTLRHIGGSLYEFMLSDKPDPR